MRYTGENLREISFPLGGIGTGCIGLAGNGRLIDWEIFNRPNKGGTNGYTGIIVQLKQNGTTYTKVLQTDELQNLSGLYKQQRFTGFGYGPERESMCGLPHFKNCEFVGEFPIAKLLFSDDDFPGKVVLTAFNPFIPGNSEESSIPAAFFTVSYESSDAADFSVFFTVRNPYEISVNKEGTNGNETYIVMKNAKDDVNSSSYGDLCIATDCPNAVTQEYWYRGGWSDGISVYWNEITKNGTLKPRTYVAEKTVREENANAISAGSFDNCAICATSHIAKGETASFRFVLSWNNPTCYAYWRAAKDEQGKDITWKNYYATKYENSLASATYSLKHFDRLWQETVKFKDAFFSQTLDEAVIDAAASTLSVLKSPTVLRLENGEFYGWEGAHEKEGSCEGTCQHVWNYAYALCFLFPDLERSIRDLEFTYNTNEDGEMQFRLRLPLGQPRDNFVPCVDGQMGAVIKTYREWKISGDDSWLSSHLDNVFKVLDYAWSDKNYCMWDKNKDGVLEGRQHHTLDMELFGPSAWLQGMYMAALSAGAEIADYFGKTDKAKEYRTLLEKGKAYTKEHLFNGEYFIQNIDIKDKMVLAPFADQYTMHAKAVTEEYWNEEAEELKYQIANGSSIDQLLGQWHATLCGLGELFDKEQTKAALTNLYKNNFVPSMRALANLWRIYALNDESGAIICGYPEGTYKPVIPIPYCEEAMHGFEYQLAGMFAANGMIKECLDVVKGVRNRYNGKNRNPWNELECGSNYARSMASFALIPVFSGFIFDMPRKTVGFCPILQGEFKSFWSLDCGWGTFEKTGTETKITILGGKLTANKFLLPYMKKVKTVTVDGIATEFTYDNNTLVLPENGIEKELIVE